jgi:hypothetical protein
MSGGLAVAPTSAIRTVAVEYAYPPTLGIGVTNSGVLISFPEYIYT